jgi:hypothetical protein
VLTSARVGDDVVGAPFRPGRSPVADIRRAQAALIGFMDPFRSVARGGTLRSPPHGRGRRRYTIGTAYLRAQTWPSRWSQSLPSGQVSMLNSSRPTSCWKCRIRRVIAEASRSSGAVEYAAEAVQEERSRRARGHEDISTTCSISRRYALRA